MPERPRRGAAAEARWAEEAEAGRLAAEADDAPEPDREYRRPARRARVRRGLAAALGGRAARMARAGWPWLVVMGVALIAYRLVNTDPAFTLAGSAAIEVAGAAHVSPAQVDRVFAADIGRNIFFIPLQARADALLQIPWVRRASVLRLWPNRLQVAIEERSPVAFARVGARVQLIDADGVLLARPARADYDFPVLTGLAGTPGGPSGGESPRAARRAQVARYSALRQALAAAGVSAAPIAEVRLRDPDDVVVEVAGPNVRAGAPIWLHLGNQEYLARYKLYLAHIAEWRRSYPSLQSVDLRYDGQAILDSGAPAAAPPASKTTASRAGRRNRVRRR